MTSVVITHDMVSSYKVADRIAMLYEGRIIEIGTPAEIQASENPVVQQFIHGQARRPDHGLVSGENNMKRELRIGIFLAGALRHPGRHSSSSSATCPRLFRKPGYTLNVHLRFGRWGSRRARP